MSTLEAKRATFFEEVQKVHSGTTLERLRSDVHVSDFIREQQSIFEACKRRQVPAPDVLDVERSACSVCPALCEAYEPFEVFQLETQERVYEGQFVPTLCRNCKCPAFFHQPIRRPLRFVAALLAGVKKYQLKQEHLNFPGIVAIFSIDYVYLEERKEQTSFKAEEDKLFQVLQEAGFQIISRSVRAISEQESVVIAPAEAPKPVNAFKSFIKTRVQSQLKVSLRTQRPVEADLHVQSLLLCLSTTAYREPQQYFGKVLQAATALLPVAFRKLYHSQNTLQALGDMEVFFPHVFEIRQCCALVAPEPRAQVLPGEQVDSVDEFFRTQHSVIRGEELITDKDPNLLNVGRVFDTLIFNGFNTWSQSQLEPEREGMLLQHLDKVLNERKAVGFLRFLLSNKGSEKLTAVAGSRVGVSLLLTNNPFSIDTFLFTHPKAIFYLYKCFFHELSHMQRTLVLFRPVTVRSGLHTLFLDIFKINRFFVLKSKFKMLTRDEALSLMPGLDETSAQGYLDCMLEGECQMVVLGKYGAVHEAQTLCDGSKYGRKRTEKSLIGNKSLILRHEKEFDNPYKVKLETEAGHEESQTAFIDEELILQSSKGVNSLFTLSPFTSLSELLDLETLVDTWMDEEDRNRDRPNVYARHKTRQELRLFARQFNFAAHCSDSQVTADREIEAFFPGLKQVSEALLVVRDSAVGFGAEIEQLFEHMQLSVVRRGAVELDSCSGDCYHVVKPGCREELRAAQAYSDHPFPPLLPQHIEELFTLVDTEPELQTGLAQLCTHVATFTADFVDRLPDSSKRDILTYVTLATLQKELKTPPPGSRDLPYRALISTLDESHIHFLATLKEGNEVEVAIRRLGSQEGASHLEDRMALFNEYEGTMWYYREARKVFPKLVPSFFHYRVEPSHPDMKVERVFFCEEYVGSFFMERVARDMIKDRNREKDTHKLVSDPNRGSISTFMWGRNLAILCQRLETVQTFGIEDCGPIYWNGREMLGSMDDLHFYELEQQKYMTCLEALKKGWTNYISVEQAIDLETKLRKIVASEAFKQTRELRSIALVPEFLSYNDVRVREVVEEGSPSDAVRGNKFIQLDLDRQARLEIQGVSLARTVHSLAITNVQPAKFPKRHLAANIYWILAVYLRKIERKAEVVGGDMDEYEALIDSLSDGFEKSYPCEESIDQISLFRMEFFLFSVWQCWKSVLMLVALDEERQQLLAQRDQSLRNVQGDFKEIVESFAADLGRVQQDSEKIDFELTHQLEQLGKVQLEPKPDPADAAKYLAMRHERYFRHYGMDEFEVNLRNPRYPDKLKEEKFPGLHEDVAKTLNPTLSRIEQMWVNPARREDINLRNIPDSAYRAVSTNVKATRWVTEEKQKKLVATFVAGLMQKSINRPR